MASNPEIGRIGFDLLRDKIIIVSPIKNVCLDVHPDDLEDPHYRGKLILSTNVEYVEVVEKNFKYAKILKINS